MRTNFDFSPFFRSSVGFDRVFDLLENASKLEPSDGWPPYDIIRTGEDSYRIPMAVAGFAEDELTLTYQPNLLVVAGARDDDDHGNFLYHGIADSKFERRFELADFVEVAEARLENGVLTIDLRRELPEEMKPRRIGITMGTQAQPTVKAGQIEHKQVT